LAAGGEIFVFLGPNGHKLNGPPSMKGKPGQCPHCGARFLIPTDEDVEETAPDQEYEDGAPLEDAEQDALPPSTPTAEAIDFSRLFPGEAAEESGEYPARPPVGAAGLGFIVSRLWERRSEASELEIFLAEGEIVAPDYYSECLSTSDYGVFAVQEGDGTYAVTVIPWNTVRRVGMRRIEELPGELFQ
jgi:hypothetical protein